LEVGATLSPQARLWVIGGLYLAVAIKIGLWPFQTWIASGEHLNRRAHAWLYATLMPNLGFYLLYRVSPLLATAPIGRQIVFWAGGVSGAFALLAVLRRSPSRPRPNDLTAILGSIIWCVASLGNPKVAWWGLLAMSVVRLPLFLAYPRAEVPPAEVSNWLVAGGRGQRVLRRLRARMETEGLDRILSTLWVTIHRLARGLYTHLELNTLDRGLESLARESLMFTTDIYATMEQQGLEGALRAVTRGALEGSHILRRRHSGRLRVSLRWIVLCIALAVVWVMCT
jgi:hypothetical protein